MGIGADCGAAPPDRGPGWEVDGELYRTNPMLEVEPWVWSVIQMWYLFKGGGMGPGLLPYPGGTMNQPSAMLSAFSVLSSTEAELKPE